MMTDLAAMRDLTEPIALPQIPAIFRADVLKFIVGETLHKYRNGDLLISHKMMKRGVGKVISRGFYYDIDLKTCPNAENETN